MKATVLLAQHHRKLEATLNALASQTHLRKPLLLELADELVAHIAIEKTILFPCAERATGSSLRAHHATLDYARVVLRKMADAVDDDTHFALKLAEMVAIWREHVVLQENELFPELERESDEYSLRRLGERITVFRGAMRKPDVPSPKTDIRTLS